MRPAIHWLVLLTAGVALLVVINLVRRRRLLETHALLWILTFVLMGISPFVIPLLDAVAYSVGIAYPPALYLLIAIFFLMANTLRNTLDLSRLTDQNRRLAQDVALLRHEVDERKRRAPHAGDE